MDYNDRINKVVLLPMAVLALAILLFSAYMVNRLDKQVKTQIEEINRQQSVIAIQQVELDSYKVNKLTDDEAKLLKDYR